MLGNAPSVVPNTTLGMHCGSFGSAPSNGWLKLGLVEFGGVAKLNAEVMSPTTPSRQAVMLGTGTPNRARINFNCEVWSNVSETISGPRLYGEMTMQGTRKPRPSGPRMPPDPGTASMLGTVTNSPGVPGGAVGGRDVVEEAAVLVIADDKCGLFPHRGIGQQDPQRGHHGHRAKRYRQGGVFGLQDVGN